MDTKLTDFETAVVAGGLVLLGAAAVVGIGAYFLSGDKEEKEEKNAPDQDLKIVFIKLNT